ncbi:ABC transporter permease [Spiractinospora alimapuensis]|uniref:ABC transporter permease n=1 Tax=Spiractinospora alimapuensis TaxID=2820884 RepID=UPI001F1BC9B3|nr:ABC transporter permease [Spiractinospora alimapuensis]QVQ53864.1 ABC transporter permease [Spiractinospora alimapuensis]
MTGASTTSSGAASVPVDDRDGRPGWGGVVRYVLRRIAGAIVSLFALTSLSFFLFRILPGDPVRAMAAETPIGAEQQEALRQQFGLDKPLWQQFVDYCVNLAQGDLGVSYQRNRPVTEIIADHLGATLLLAGTGTVIAAMLGLWLGSRAAWRYGSRFDRLQTGTAIAFWSVPTFWLGLILLSLLAAGIGPLPSLFPTGGMSSGGGGGPLATALDTAHHMVLPVATMVAVIYAQYLMIMRSSMLDERSSDYLVSARAKGLRDALVLRRHAIPNALLPTVTLIFLNLGQVVAGSILVETVFSWPGLGRAFYTALHVPDLPLVQGLFLFLSAAVIFMNLIADLIYPFLDPRVRS